MSVQNSMSIHTLVDVVPNLPARTSILIRGAHGIGKSQIVRQIARLIALKEKINDYEVIDRRLSQMTEGDMIGLPSIDDNVTRFNPPDWYKVACTKPCVLFLDELNRATHEVMQAAFQIVLDRELNGWKLHPGTRVFAAINSSSQYIVNEIDPALLDRFWAIDLKPDAADWLAWARGEGKIASVIIDFISQNEKWLDPAKNAEFNSVEPSRRSWEMLSIALENAGVIDDVNNAIFYPICLGFIGVEASISFLDFVKTMDIRLTGKDIIEAYDSVRSKVKKLTQDHLNDIIEKVAEFVTKNIVSLNEKQGKNLKKFMTDIPAELRISCWSKLTASGLDKLELAKSVHKYCGSTILDVFGVPMGEAGVGVTPNIPEKFKSK